MIGFSWDEEKERKNRIKHGLGFAEAIPVFDDPSAIALQDRIVGEEPRWQIIGWADTAILLVAYAVLDEEDVMIRVISARKATRKERRLYEEAAE